MAKVLGTLWSRRRLQAPGFSSVQPVCCNHLSLLLSVSLPYIDLFEGLFYLKDKVTERDLPSTSQTAANSCSWGSLKSGARSFHMDAGAQASASFHCLSRYPSREVEWKWSSRTRTSVYMGHPCCRQQSYKPCHDASPYKDSFI